MYPPPPLQTTNLIYLTKFQFLLSSTYACTAYYLSNQPMDITRFSMFLGMCILVALTAEGFGLYLGTLDNTVVSFNILQMI